MLEKDILLIINPNASKGRGRKKAHEIKDAFQRNSRQCTIAYTNGPNHAAMLAKKGVLYEYKVIVAAGGDGTVNEVLNGIMSAENHENVTMGIIPIGRGNDFAWQAGIPGNIIKAVDLILANKADRVDIGLCVGTGHKNGLYFFNGAGFGFEPAVNFRAMGYRHLNGMPSYIAAFIYILFHFPSPYHIRMVIDGDERILDTQQISVCNGRRMGSAFMLAPNASIADGYFDVMYTNQPLDNMKDILKTVFAFLRGSHVSDKEVFSYQKAKNVIIDSEEAVVEAHCDGEVFSRSGKHFELTLLPSALKLIHGKEKC